MQQTLTAQQAAVLNAIVEAGDIGPTYEEIAAKVGISKTRVHSLIQSLVKRKRIRKEHGKHRSYVVL